MHDEAPLEVAGRVAAAAAHDFNNHVAAIALQAELALASVRPEDEKMRRRLEEILGSCNAARGLTRNLLAFGARRALHPVRVDIADAVEQLAGPGVSVAIHGQPLIVEVDDAVFREALAQVVGFAGEGDAAVAARADGDAIEVRFSRRGPEPDDEARRRFFEPFASEDKALGLATVYGFVRQCGGTIVLERAPGGAEVVLRLPRAAS
jgi:two-component system, cell cycle sensor histidine kinase and response regulator CckA